MTVIVFAVGMVLMLSWCRYTFRSRKRHEKEMNAGVLNLLWLMVSIVSLFVGYVQVRT